MTSFVPTNERWSYIAALVWIATRSLERAKKDESKSFNHIKSDLPTLAPWACDLSQARAQLFGAVRRGALSGLATKKTWKNRNASWPAPVADAKRQDRFPPKGHAEIADRLEEFPNDVLLRNCFRERSLQDGNREVRWSCVNFAGLDLLRLWPEYADRHAYAVSREEHWAAPADLDLAEIRIADGIPRLDLDSVVNILAFGQRNADPDLSTLDKTVSKLRAATALFRAAAAGSLQIVGKPAFPRESLSCALRVAARQIDPLEFDNDELTLSPLATSAITTSRVLQGDPDTRSEPEAVKWFDVLVDKNQLATWIQGRLSSKPAIARSKGTSACTNWLVEMRKTVVGKPAKKAVWFNLAVEKFGVSGRQFDACGKRPRQGNQTSFGAKVAGRKVQQKNRPRRKPTHEVIVHRFFRYPSWALFAGVDPHALENRNEYPFKPEKHAVAGYAG